MEFVGCLTFAFDVPANQLHPSSGQGHHHKGIRHDGPAWSALGRGLYEEKSQLPHPGDGWWLWHGHRGPD